MSGSRPDAHLRQYELSDIARSSVYRAVQRADVPPARTETVGAQHVTGHLPRETLCG